MNIIDNNIRKVTELCKQYKVKNLYVFGSILTPLYNENSDLDFLVSFNENEIPLLDFGDNFFGLQFALEDIFNRKVDLIFDNAVHNTYFLKEVDATKQLIYG